MQKTRGDTSSIPGSGRSPEEGNVNTFQYFCLENPMVRGAWQATAQGSQRVGYNWSNLVPACVRARTHTHTHTHTHTDKSMVRTEWDVQMLRRVPNTEILHQCQLNMGVNNVFWNIIHLGSSQFSSLTYHPPQVPLYLEFKKKIFPKPRRSIMIWPQLPVQPTSHIDLLFSC